MSAADLSVENALKRIPDGLVQVGVYPTARAGFEHGLVVLAMGESYWQVPDADGHHLLVEPSISEVVREQLARFDRESIGWPPRPVRARESPRTIVLFSPFLWALVVLMSFRLQTAQPSLVAMAALDTQAVFDQHEWWRVATALFLHADVGHLVSNVISGILVLSAVLTTFGRVRGWLLLTLASLAGNLTVAALHYPGPYRSLGASTAIFAGLGLLTGRAIRRRDDPHRWRTLFAPLAAGLTLLGMLGAGGLQTDVLAHGTGFAGGLFLGFAAADPPARAAAPGLPAN